MYDPLDYDDTKNWLALAIALAVIAVVVAILGLCGVLI